MAGPYPFSRRRTPSGTTVRLAGRDPSGPAQRGFLRGAGSEFTYTIELRYRFTLVDDLGADLVIAP